MHARPEMISSLQSGAKELLNGGLDPVARVYALRELARRAGVSSAFASTWELRLDATHTSILVGPLRTEIRVRHDQGFSWEGFERGKYGVQRALWPCGVRNVTLVQQSPELLVPFARDLGTDAPAPLFVRRAGRWECDVDLLLSCFLMLNRCEELLEGQRDEHDRYPGTRSLAFREGFVERPVIDELGVALGLVLEQCVPGWRYTCPEASYLLSHDIDRLEPRARWRSAAGHLKTRRNPRAFVRDTLGRAFGARSAFMNSVLATCSYAASRGLRSSAYFMHAPKSRFDSGYSLRDPQVPGLIAELQSQGVILGAHPGYETYQNRGRLRQQLDGLRGALGARIETGRQHYLRWNHRTWSDWEACGMKLDSTLGFAKLPGFRCGTSVGFQPWLFDAQRPAQLVEVPLTLMEATVFGYQGEHRRDGDFVQKTQALLERVKLVGGTMSLLIHNDAIITRSYRSECLAAMDALSGMPHIGDPDSYLRGFDGMQVELGTQTTPGVSSCTWKTATSRTSS